MRGQLAEIAVSEEDAMRANLYGLLGSTLFNAPTDEMLSSLAGLKGDSSELGRAFLTLSKLAAATDQSAARDEYDSLFIGMGRGELLPFGSYYLTGFLNEKPLAKLRNAMTELGISRNDDVKEPEDHIGSLMEMMSGLISGTYGTPASTPVQQQFFATHIDPWASHFFSDLEKAETSRLYQPVGTIGRLFVSIEGDAFSMG